MDRDNGMEIYFAHIRQIEEVVVPVVLGANHLGLALMDKVGILFGKADACGHEYVIPFHVIKVQISVSHFKSVNGPFLGVKGI